MRTREPVGSRALVERYRLGVSPATIRNDMAVLEDEGYIHQPHTSAGRVPTEKGYRLYLDEKLCRDCSPEQMWSEFRSGQGKRGFSWAH